MVELIWNHCAQRFSILKHLDPRRSWIILLTVLSLGVLSPPLAEAQAAGPFFPQPSYGPYNGIILAGGLGLEYPLRENDPMWATDASWTMYGWVQTTDDFGPPTLLAGVGDPLDEYSRFFGVVGGKLVFRMGEEDSLSSNVTLSAGKWHLVAATFDGVRIHLFSDGVPLVSGPLEVGTVKPVVKLAPEILPWPQARHFGGRIAGFTVLRNALDDHSIAALYQKPVDFSLIEYDRGSKAWPVQVESQSGLREPQDPATLPVGVAPFSKPRLAPVSSQQPALEPNGAGEWTLGRGWRLAEEAKVTASGAEISQPGFAAEEWLKATVPGTVLTTLIDRGVYPDPNYGLNNMAIPESLNRQRYWYRTAFVAPSSARGKRFTLTFNGINYAADVWVNGREAGKVKGAFLRGTFDVTDLLKPGRENSVAVLISPPPHPGVPHEQSLLAGPGPNGGMMALDGPTFVDTEGWDWIPAIRDRDMGIWQSVTLTATADIKIRDPQIVTTLPLPDTSRAEVAITVPVTNMGNAPVRVTVSASFEDVAVTQSVMLLPGEGVVQFSPRDFPQLIVQNPRLWWPNGYGKPELYHLVLKAAVGGRESDQKALRFGIREITYEMSLFDSTGHLRRVEVSPSLAVPAGQALVDDRNSGLFQQSPYIWAPSLAPASESSPAVRAIDDLQTAPYLVIKVNGVRIACRGGNWGMDDDLKRVSRSHLEPYFRLHRDANLNIIRNWVGQSTEETFYELADEYGLLVWNDFWSSTQDYNLEPEDPELFLKNARDTILRFRNHPSIAIWCGRNEGVPPAVINNGLAELTRSLDGTRQYFPSSNQVNLARSGPYLYEDPALYFTTLARGFAVEVGTASMPTLEAFRAMVPEADQWPISDTWAYHDWHQSGNGDVVPFMAHLQAQFGAATSLEDFERKAQMLNYVSYRAIFEGFNAHLWAPNSGRLLWMTQSAWPSTMQQILSHDYDTHASFYAVKKACEPVHVQLNLPDNSIAVVNTTTNLFTALSVTARVYSLDSKLLLERQQSLNVDANSEQTAFPLELGPLFAAQVVLVKLELRSPAGQLLSNNFYWLAGNEVLYRQLKKLPPATLAASAASTRTGDEVQVRVQVRNVGTVVALAGKLTIEKAGDGTRILPAYLSDNYLSLLPGESREIEIEYPATEGAAKIAFRGWNLSPFSVSVAPQ